MQTIAYLGPEKTNTHYAARKKFGAKAKYVHAPTVEDVFRLVERRRADFGVVPIENSLEGAVTHTLDRFIDFTPVRIFGEMELPIEHCLIAHAGTAAGKIHAIFSHPQALAQCRGWLHKRYPRAQLFETASTADAVGEVAKKTPRAFSKFRVFDSDECAAIGRRELAREFGLVARPMPIARENKTRFLVISLKQPQRQRRNKTSLMFALKDKPGALHDALVPFKKNEINLTKIESRPTKRRAWEYVFFVDFNGHVSDPRIRRALKDLRRDAEVRVLGSYPVGGRG